MLGIICLFLIACGHNAKEEAVLIDTDGVRYSLKNYPKHWIIINYWASWCGPCREEIPQLDKFYAKYHQQVLLFGVNFDQIQGDDLKQAIKRMRIKFPVLMNNPAAIFNLTTVPGLPTTFIINPKGELVKTLYGPQTVNSLRTAVKIEK
jgi:thiol-disulfide isomerase/thioredoxin